MKATINGITYEGTYEEITAIITRMTLRVEANPNLQPLRHTGGWWGIFPPVNDYTKQRTTGRGTWTQKRQVKGAASQIAAPKMEETKRL